MKFSLTTIFVVLLFANAIFAEAEVDESDVIILDHTNFDEVVNKHPLLLVEFYAPWCGHCKRLVPEYAKAATELKDSNIFLAKINVDEESNKPIGDRMGIQGFPTLKVFTDGQASEYEGGRTAAEIVTYMKRQSLPAVSLLNSTEQLVQLFEDKVTSIVGFFKDEAGEAYQSFASVAKTLKNTFPFSAVLNLPELAKQHGSHDDDHIVVWNAADGKKYTISGDELKNLAASISKYGNPLLDEIGPHNFKNYMESGLPLVYVFLKLTEKDSVLDQVREIAEETRGKVNWVFIDNDKYARHGENLGLSGKTVPAIVLDDVANGLHYVYDETAAIAKDLVKAWSDKFLSGELKPNVKSEEIPENNNGPVKIVVQKSFKDLVLDEEKAVLVEFYAPWCGHCKTLAPIYEEVGTAYSSVSDVIIAKMDATANDVDKKYQVRGYPTLKFFPKGSDKTPVDYQGNRSKQDLIDFLNKQTGNNVDAGAIEDEKDEL